MQATIHVPYMTKDSYIKQLFHIMILINFEKCNVGHVDYIL
jgi:hypothetical protein